MKKLNSLEQLGSLIPDGIETKKPFDIDNSPLIKPTSKILFGSVFVIIGFIQLIPLLN